MSALTIIKNAGFDLSLYGDSFKVTPSSLLSTTQREFLKIHKDEIITELQQSPVTCGQCLHFKCNNSHGAGAGSCLVGGAYGAWSETQHQCPKFDAAVEWVVMPEPSPNAIMVTVYTPNGNAIEIEARDEAHAVWLQQMNPKPI
ncbi:MAG: hypothetical protein RLZ75_1932 [Pseudomonadota bacterium]